MLMSHPDLPGVVRDVTDEAFTDHWTHAGWVEAYPPPEDAEREDEQPEDADTEDQES